MASGKDEAQLVASKRGAGAAYRYMCVLILLYMQVELTRTPERRPVRVQAKVPRENLRGR